MARYKWKCQSKDENNGDLDADFTGQCGAEARKEYESEKQALALGQKHKCRFSNSCIFIYRSS